MRRTLSDAMVMTHGGVLRWVDSGEPVTSQDLVDWFDVAYPEPWKNKARRLALAAREVAEWETRNPRRPSRAVA